MSNVLTGVEKSSPVALIVLKRTDLRGGSLWKYFLARKSLDSFRAEGSAALLLVGRGCYYVQPAYRRLALEVDAADESTYNIR